MTGDELLDRDDAPGTTVQVLFIDMLTGGRDLAASVVPEQVMPEWLDHAGKAYLKRRIGGRGRPYWYVHAGGREGRLRSYSQLRSDSQVTPRRRPWTV